jgi:hypothetical protein
MRNTWDALDERPEPEDSGVLRPGAYPDEILDGDVWRDIYNGLLDQGYGPVEATAILGALGYDPTPQGNEGDGNG